MPPAQDIVFSELSLKTMASSNRSGLKGEIDFKGWARTKDTLASMSEGILASAGKMITKDVRQDSAAGSSSYPLRFEAAVLVEKEGVKETAKTDTAAPAKPPPGASAKPAASTSAKPTVSTSAKPAAGASAAGTAASATSPKTSATGAAR